MNISIEKDLDLLKKGLDLFFSKYKPIFYKKGSILIRPDDPINDIFYIKRGLIRQYIISEDGEDLTINIFRPNSFFPIMIILSEVPNKYNFEAIEDTEGYKAPPEKVVEFLKKEPEILLDLTKRFAQAINGLAQRIEDVHFKQSYLKIASILVYLVKSFGEKEDKETSINLSLTHKDLASWTGLTRETVSRQIEKFIKENIIEQRNRVITIKNLSKLKDLANRTL